MGIREVLGFVRVNAHRGINPIVTLGDGQRRVQAIGACASTCHQDVTKAGGAGAFNHCRAVGVEVGIVKVGVGIKKESVDRVIG